MSHMPQSFRPTNQPPSSHSWRGSSQAWVGYTVIAVLCSAGVWGVIFGLRSPSTTTTTTSSTNDTDTKTVSNPVEKSTAAPVKDPPLPSPPPTGGDRTTSLVIQDLTVGRGAVARSGDVIKVHYVGTLVDGKEFDSSKKHGNEPFKFDLGKGRVIKGWDQGVLGMREGGKRKLTVPPHLGYGARSIGTIPPNATMTFEVELVEIEKKAGEEPRAKPADGGDPHGGSYSLEEATQDLPGKGKLIAEIDTSQGRMTCQLIEDNAPNTVANFIGLATGKRTWKDPTSNQWVNRPAYNGTTFHRVIKSFMIQGGDPKGTGSGEPGYTIKDENTSAKHDRAGLLCMANRGPNTNGAQFFITDAAAPHIDNGYTVFGDCTPLNVVHDIAGVKTGPMDRPETPVTIKNVTISRLP
jgi:peptidyl-prolyl cis-trans isomerase A (cyclophilin A)